MRLEPGVERIFPEYLFFLFRRYLHFSRKSLVLSLESREVLDLHDLPKIAKRPQDFSFPVQELLAFSMKLARELRTSVLPQDMAHEFARRDEPTLFRGALHLGRDLFRQRYVHDRSHTVIQSICIVLQLSRRPEPYSKRHSQMSARCRLC